MWLLSLKYSEVELATLWFILEGGWWRKLVTWACFLGWDWDHSTTNTTLQTWRLPFSNSIFYAITCCTTLLILHVWRNWANVQKLEVIHHLSTLGWMRKLERRRRFFASPHKYEPVNHYFSLGFQKSNFYYLLFHLVFRWSEFCVFKVNKKVYFFDTVETLLFRWGKSSFD